MHLSFAQRNDHLEIGLTAFSALWVISHHNEGLFFCSVHTADQVYQKETRTNINDQYRPINKNTAYLSLPSLTRQTADGTFGAVTVIPFNYRLILRWPRNISHATSRVSR
jgi:hypothetical protein